MRILIIEDDHKIAQALKKGLEQEHFAADITFNGEEGAGQASTIKYDLLILDRMLPGMDGIEICKFLREKNNNTPILMLTAKDTVSDRVAGLNAGADDYLVKPFAFEELLARVKALLRRPEQEIGTTLKVGNLTLDTISFIVTRAGRNIELSSTEFRLLEYLMRNTGRIVTKEMIINHVWDYDADILPNTVEVFIGYLRNKIDRAFAFPDSSKLITTVRGFGYKLG